MLDDAMLPAHVLPTADAISRHYVDVRRRLDTPPAPVADMSVTPEPVPGADFGRGLILSSCNRAAVDLCHAFAVGGLPFDSLLIVGPRGSGRTTLLREVARVVPGLVTLDDVDVTARYLPQGTPFVATSCVPPSQIEGLGMMFDGALVVHLPAPGFFLLCDLIRLCIEGLEHHKGGFRLSPQLTGVVAMEARGSCNLARGLVGALFGRYCQGETVTAMTIALVASQIRGEVERHIRVEDIVVAVCRLYGVTRNELMSQRRAKRVVRPRQVAIYLACTLTRRSTPEIGRVFGGRDHTTILHARERVKALKESEPGLGDQIEALTTQIQAVLS